MFPTNRLGVTPFKIESFLEVFLLGVLMGWESPLLAAPLQTSDGLSAQTHGTTLENLALDGREASLPRGGRTGRPGACP